jgi:outer membrane receptor protein involved in Fe transport
MTMTTTSTYVFKLMNSPVGTLRLVASDKGLAGVWFERSRPERVRPRGDQESPRHPVLVETERQLRLNVDWQPAAVPSLSLDLAVVGVGDRPAGAAPQAALGGRQFTVGGRTTLDLGARWRFPIGDARAVARLLVQNVTDDRRWDVAGSGAFVLPNPRRVSLAVTADF